MINKDLKKRILEISYKYKLSHLGSCLTAVDIIKKIYDTKRADERFVLSAGHAGLAWYVVKEALGGRNAEAVFNHHGVHPDRCNECDLDCSSGSLGHGLPIAVGMALADRSKNVYCLISDGECAEGSIYEALTIMRTQKIINLYIYCNANGFAAYRKVNTEKLDNILQLTKRGIKIIRTTMDDWPIWLQGQAGHYVIMDEAKYKEAIKLK